MRLTKPADRRDSVKTLKVWCEELCRDADGIQSLQYELIQALLGLRSQANRDGWMNWGSNYEELVDLLLKFFPSGPRRDGIHADLEAIREAGQTGADHGRMAYKELDRLCTDLVQWCVQRRELILLPEGHLFWSDVPPEMIPDKKSSWWDRLF